MAINKKALNTNYSTVSNPSRRRDNSVFVGFVKNNSDAQKMGRLSVYIPELCGEPDDSSTWIIVQYASPFYGATPLSKIQNNATQAGSQQSYGWWAIPPDLDAMVLCAFVDGDTAKGYWWACIPQQNMNFMIPGIPSGPTNDPNAKGKYLPPTVEYNKLASQTQDPNNPQRPIYAPLSNGLSVEGLAGDFERGPSSSSARREAPSKVYGYLTPDGSQLYADDNPQNQFIRFRTKSGVQILIHETTGYVYINSKSGNSWIEVSDLGVDIYSENSVSIRGQKDVNIRADKNINLDAGQSINLRAGSNILLQAGKSIQLGANSGMVLSVSNGKLSLSSSSDMLMHAGGAWRSDSTGDTTMLAGGNMYRTASKIDDNGPAAPAVPANSAAPQNGTVLPDVSGGKGSTLNTTVSRMPTHEPFLGHPKSNVPPIIDNPTPVQSPGNGSNTPTQIIPNTTTQMTGDGNKVSLQNTDGNQCGLGVGTRKCSDDVYNAIQTASSQTGAPFGSMMAIAARESGFQPGAASNQSTATGLYQFLGGTWSGMKTQYGGKYNVSADASATDPNANALMGGAYYQQNAQALMNKGISNPSCGQVYLCNMLGTSGGPKFIQAAQQNPNAPLTSVLTQQEINNNAGWFKGCTTVGQAYDKINGTMNADAAAYDMQAGLPSPCSRAGATGATGASTPGGASATGTPPTQTNPTGPQGP